MTNNERFCAFLNSCKHPRQVFNSLRALASALKDIQQQNEAEKEEEQA